MRTDSVVRAPTTFTTLRQRSSSQSIAKRTPISAPYCSMPTACRTISIVTSPAEGMPGAPTADRVEKERKPQQSQR